jgi:hypothetical protein
VPRTKFPLTHAQVRELYRLYGHYWKEASRCETAKAYQAGCVMLGSALECLLLLFIDVHHDEAMQTPTAKKGLRIEGLLKWDLAHLIGVATDAKWLPHGLKLYRRRTPKGRRIEVRSKWSPRKAKIGDYVTVLRDIRNLVHPGRYAREHRGTRITKKYFDGCEEEVLTIARDWLLEKIYADLWPILMPGVPREFGKVSPKGQSRSQKVTGQQYLRQRRAKSTPDANAPEGN